MRNGRYGIKVAAWSIAAALFAGDALGAQDAMTPEAERARQLIARIQRSMSEVDDLLLAGARSGNVEKKLEQNASDIEKLIEEALSKSRSISDSIEELLKMAKYQQSQSGGS